MEETLGQRIKRLRLSLGLNQTQLAGWCGCGAGSISKWERDQQLPGNRSLLRLAQALRVSLDDLLWGEAAARDFREGQRQLLLDPTILALARQLCSPCLPEDCKKWLGAKAKGKGQPLVNIISALMETERVLERLSREEKSPSRRGRTCGKQP